jgi:integrase
MPTQRQSSPAYRHYKPKNLAVVRIDGRDFYLGKYDSPESWRRYHQLLADRAAERMISANLSQSALASSPALATLCVKELCLGYLCFAERYYCKDGKVTSEVDCIRHTLRRLIKLYGDIPAAELGPRALKEVRDEFVRQGLTRSTINNNIGRIKRMYRWAVENELIPVMIYQALSTVAGLRRGRTPAKEPEPVRPVSEAHIDAALPFMPPPIRTMAQLQRLSGCRPGEICLLRPCDLDCSSEVWCYRPASHKTQHKGLERRVFFGPKSQQLLTGWLDRPPAAFCFSPAEEVRRQLLAKHQSRVTPPGYGNRPGTNRKKEPIRTPGERYTTSSYHKAVERACRQANTPVWSPNQLRHARATELRRLHGLDAAQVVLGHTEAFVTQIYAERDFSRAESLMRELG